MVPTAATAMAYMQAVMAPAGGGIVQGLAIAGMGNAQISVFHAASFVVGNAADGGAPAPDAARVADAAAGSADARPTATEDAPAPRAMDAPPATSPPRADAAAMSQPAGGSEPDAGAHKSTKSGGCSCSAGGRAPRAVLVAPLILAAALRRRSRRRF
jgi:MYXO-CTERM domain-containing protein